MKRNHFHALVLVLAFVIALACACTSTTAPKPSAQPAAADSSTPPPAAQPWTDAFLAPAVLVADEIRIEGPAGLREHMATRAEPELHERTEKTTAQGFLTEIHLRAGHFDAPIKAWLDQLELAAMVKLVVLERPGLVDVTLSARGQVLWVDKRSKQEKRSENFSLSGKLVR